MGIMSHDYAQLNVDDDLDIIEGFRGAGLSHSAGVGRLSYMFGFEGPSIAIDSASSSSLVAVCQASKSLLESECNVALAGGVNAILTPTNSLLLCKAGMLSTDGRCKSFSAAADGFGRGEGCGVVVLKRRRDAERDGDRILAVIRGSAISHNGYSGSLTAPSGRSQERVIREALEHARIKPADVDYLEAHGTGTELGDPIEMAAAAAVLGKGRSKENPLLVGSVKANIGHLEAAGGISGLIKVVLSMQQGLIPRQLHFDEPSPHIAWDRIPVKMVVEPTQWPKGETRIASVTALGMSGTNAHVVLESVAANQSLVLHQGSTGDPALQEDVEPRSHHLLVLSAKTDSGLMQVAKRYGDWFEESAPNIADACHTAAVGRKHWQHRASVVVESTEQATKLLRAFERGESASSLIRGQVCKSPKLAWMFSGEGSEYLGMGENLYRTQPVFRAAVDRYDEQLWQDREGSLRNALFQNETLLSESMWSQPALFVLQAALAKLWQSWGVEPDVVLGNGLGQYAAACVAGVMTWEDGLRLVAGRSRIMTAVPEGAMLMAGGQNANSIASTALDEFERFADCVDYFPADRPLICNLSGDVVPVHRLLGGSYWRRHAAEPVQFAKSIATLAAQDCTLVLEIGPGADLCDLATACWPGKAPHFMPSMCRDQNQTQSVLTALGQIYVNGIIPDFRGYDAACPRHKIQMPTYPFERSRYWITDVSKYVNEQLNQRTSSAREDQE
jgi:acyl transferase domain-containing protein